VILEIVHVPDCPGADLLTARLDELLAGRPGSRVIRRVVTGEADAERLGMTGSPTLLADGADPFARPGQLPSVSCRLYLDEQGRQGPAPSSAQLRAALDL
jgi:hypothetical protein